MSPVNIVVGKIVLMLAITHNVISETAKFRILAPEFICPKDEESLLDKPDNTIITVKTEASDVQLQWIVRWKELSAPSQRFTILLWRTVRALEAKFNGPQPEPFVYIINNAELLRGVSYIFNVTAIEKDVNEDDESTKSFEIDNTQGDHVLMIEGRSEKFSVVLVGGQLAYADMEYVLEAQVTTCHHTQDYYFEWAVYNLQSHHAINISETRGRRLEVPAYALRAGLSYDVRCQLFRHTTGEFITQTNLPIQVLHRELEVSLNVDLLIVPARSPFILESTVVNHDNQDMATFAWDCMFDGTPCDDVERLDSPTLFFPTGSSKMGRYEISLTVYVMDQSACTNASIIVSDENLPLIGIAPVPRTLNVVSVTSLMANASNVSPTCTLTWYFASQEIMTSSMHTVNDTCVNDSCQHGEPLSDSLTIYSLEENFLNELADFSNETEWRQVTAQLDAAAGRARFVAQCGCSLTFSCGTKGIVYADISFQLNPSPKAGDVIITPESGSALETVYRISTLSAIDMDAPLRYNFYTNLGTNDSLLLASYVEHLAVEIFLPYLDGTTDVWLEVCDSLGACSLGSRKSVQVSSGEARSVDALMNDVTAHVRRCEISALRRVVQSAVVTYMNAGQDQALSVFTSALLEDLPMLAGDCIERNSEHYTELIRWLGTAGIHIFSTDG